MVALPRMHVDDTMGRIDLEQPLAPKGGRLTITMNYAFRVPEHGSDRMGRDGTLYEIAQWYPRMAVYDDIRGWNTDPYFGQGEFYLEYGDIDYSVTAPAGYTIAGSGVLQNAAEVLTAAQRERLARAARSDSTVAIITDDEARATPTPGTRTWRFRAQNVRDVAWAGAPDFRWDAANANGVLAQAYYQIAKAGKAWEQAAEQTAWTIRNYSELFFRYPYPQATSVAGPVGGMEYPMFVMVHYGDPKDDPKSIFGTINHEHGHEWFPMIVGSNERRYAWQDEGFNTYINAFALRTTHAGHLTVRGLRGQLAPDGGEPRRCSAHDAARSHRRACARCARLPQAGRRAPRPARQRRRPRDVRSRVPRVHAALGVQASVAGRLLPHDRERVRHGSRLVLARLLVFDRRARHRHRQRDDAPAAGTEHRGDRAAAEHAGAISGSAAAAASGTTPRRTSRSRWRCGPRASVSRPSSPSRAAVIGARLWPEGIVPDWNATNDAWGTPVPVTARRRRRRVD